MPGTRKPRPSPEPLLVDLDATRKMLGGPGPHVIDRLVKSGELIEVRFGRLRLFQVESIRRVAGVGEANTP